MTRRQPLHVGQRLINGDGTTGGVALHSQGTRVFGPGAPFLVEWLDLDGKTVEDVASYMLEDLEREGITCGRGRMPWAR
jgi:hypothetical protein